jgi:HAD superfamily hydrolase (TIGR01509 family)
MNRLAVIFDMDGVLVDSYQTHLASWKRAAAERGLGMTDADFARTFGRTSRDIIHLLWPGKCSDEEAALFDVRKEALYREILGEHFPEMDGAGELIGALHAAGFALAVGSSGPPENVELVRGKIGNGGFFTAAVTGAEVKRGKPDPQVFLLAAGKLGIEPAHCAVIEDAPVGVEAARRAGMYSIGLLGTAAKEKLAAHAHIVVASLRELSPGIIAGGIESEHH